MTTLHAEHTCSVLVRFFMDARLLHEGAGAVCIDGGFMHRIANAIFSTSYNGMHRTVGFSFLPNVRALLWGRGPTDVDKLLWFTVLHCDTPNSGLGAKFSSQTKQRRSIVLCEEINYLGGKPRH